MCGIVGILGNPEGSLETSVRSMRDVFPYRGPDAKGIWTDTASSVALGHVRLSILDVSDAGRQPMCDEQKDFWIVFNGEIYNYIELRNQLKGRGYIFRTGTDTEVILAAYREWGNQCLEKFNGMWAFAIWEERNKRLFLARDRLGIKPLYYYQVDGCFYFASEIKAIRAALKKSPHISEDLIDVYVSFGYIPGEDTLFSGVKRLLPGHSMIVSLNGLSVKKYWDLCFDNTNDLGIDYYINRGRELLEDAIKIRLRSDVPLGIFLSGGLDSSTVVGLLAQHLTEPLKTFSVGYDFGPQYNETRYARMVANKFHTEHYEKIVTPKEFQDFIPRFVWLMDEPVTESAAISLYFISLLAKSQVTVVLSGEGSDEIFAGYDFYRYMIFLERYRHVIGAKAAGFISKAAGLLFSPGNKIRKYLSLGALPLEKRYKGISTYDEDYKEGLYGRAFKHFIKTRTTESSIHSFLGGLFDSTQNHDGLSRMLYFDIKTWLVDDLLIKADRMSMAASLELRVPFLDYRLVEFAASMPSQYKIKNGVNKVILKQMVKDILPKEIIYRKKMGFPTPLKMMFQKQLSDYARDLLLSPNAKIHAYFNKNQLENLLEAHLKKQKDHHRMIWQLVVLETWMQSFNA